MDTCQVCKDKPALFKEDTSGRLLCGVVCQIGGALATLVNNITFNKNVMEQILQKMNTASQRLHFVNALMSDSEIPSKKKKADI